MLSRYNLEFQEFHPLGKGAFSTVFKAKSIKNGITYAIKKIPFKSEELTDTQKEIEILRSLNSDFVVSYIDSWTENNYYIGTWDIDNPQDISSGNLLYSQYKPLLLHIQMELCSITLKQFIKQIVKTKPNTIDISDYFKSCDVFVQILECVQYLHSHEPPIIHRDLKPENIMLINETNGLKVKLTDFGLSTYHNFVDQSHTKYIGTKGYRAPEVDRAYYTIKADIYSLGKIMENLFNIYHDRQLNEISGEIQTNYENAKRICLKCVSYDPSLRPDCQQILSKQNLWNNRKNQDLLKYILNTYSQKWRFSSNKITELIYNCKNIAVIEEVEEKFIYVTKDKKIYSLKNREDIDSMIHGPKNISELFRNEIQSILSGHYHVLCLTYDKRIQSFGDNDCGQLGNGTFLSSNKPMIIEAFNDKRMIDIKCGAYHSLALSESGCVYSWGSGHYGQIGNGFNHNETNPYEIESFNTEKIVSITCGLSHCLALSKKGKLYGWGDNLFGQLGIGNNRNQNKPKIILFPALNVKKKICCGSLHSLVLTENFELYAFGYNAFGQLGIGSKINKNKPKKIKTSVKFIDIETMFNQSLSLGLSEDNKYYIWGKCNEQSICEPILTNFNSFLETFVFECNYILFSTNKYINKLNEWKRLNRIVMSDLLSLSLVRIKESKAIIVTNDDILYTFRLNQSSDSSVENPVIVKELCNKRIKTIICGYTHGLCLTENSEVYSFGDIQFCQKDNGSTINNFKPTFITELNNKHIIDISCGYFHCLALSKSGEVFAWVYGFDGQIGNGCIYYKLNPTKIKSFSSVKISAISCGAYHCLSLSKNGKLFGWGDNRFGQLGVDSIDKCTKPILIKSKKSIIKISCGHSHNLLLTNDNIIYSFGRNDFCQLGIGNKHNQNKITKIETTIKFVDIYTTFCDHISSGLSQTGKYYIWGKCGDNVIESPIETELTSFGEIFAKYSIYRFSAKQIDLP